MTPIDSILARLLALHPKRIDLSLDRMSACSTRSAIPSASCRRSSMSPAPTARARPSPSCARCWRPPGKRVHVYTSPHLVRFNERFRLGAPGGGALVSDEALADALDECERANGGAPITVFEIDDRGGVPAVRAPSGRRAAARSRARRPARRHQRDRAPLASVDHAGVDRSPGISRRHASRRSPPRRPASSSAACRRSIAPQTDARAGRDRAAGRARARAAARRRRGLDRAPRSTAGWSIRTTTACSICRRRSSSAAISSTMPALAIAALRARRR